jgi:hypothetical protein
MTAPNPSGNRITTSDEAPDPANHRGHAKPNWPDR